MAKGVNRSDYRASAAELENAKVAQSEYQKYKAQYKPVLVQRGVDSQSDAIKTTLRGRANADAMQQLDPQVKGVAAANSTSVVGNVAQGLQGQLGEANRRAREYQNNQGASTLALARQQAGTAQEGLAQVSRLGTSSALARAQAKEQVAQAKVNALAQVGSTLAAQGMENLSMKRPDGTSSFFTPGVQTGVDEAGKPIYRQSQSLAENWSVGTGRMRG